MTICKVCGNVAHEYGNAIVLGKYKVSFFQCDYCGFIQSEEPYWLEESYSTAIADTDIGIIHRNSSMNKTVTAIIECFFRDGKTFLDYGGGYGIFTRMMRDSGFDFQWYDKYCENLFAKTHEMNRSHYDVLTAFELMEHLQNPKQDFVELCNHADNIICSTELQPTKQPDLNQWWYFCLDVGSHISFYTEVAMRVLAAKVRKYYSHYGSIHIFSQKPINKFGLWLCCRYPGVINRFLSRESLLLSDYKALTGKTIG